ncbi:MAG: serine hydrolase [Desulfurococcales archaeon ex4484_58]|nr:MAG: serine hydrolase [Desulfurococcales archaeon ex4484_58]
MDFSRLDSFILSKMSETKLPSISICIVHGDEVVYARSYGFKDLENGLPATTKTIYGIGSITKSFTALAIMKLVEEERISLDDEVSKYVPLDLRIHGEPVKIYHLLTHSSGIPALAYAEAFIRGSLGLDHVWLPVAKPEDIIVFMDKAREWAVAKPGERFYYLNEGYVLLGYIISKVTGVDYEDYVKKTILKPLGMNRTYFREEDVSRDLDVAVPYIVDREGRHVRSKFPYGITADGGLLSNVEDMSIYLRMFIGRGEYNGVRIVGREFIEAMEKKHVDIPSKLFGDEGYGYGLSITNKFFDRKLVGHSGSVLVYTAYMGYVLPDNYGVVVMANASGYPLSLIGMYALSLALGRDPDKELIPIKNENILKKLEGRYETYKGTHSYIVKREGEFLLLRYTDKYTEYTVILVPKIIREDYVKVYTLSYGRVVEAEFLISDGEVQLFFERYKLVKK